MEYVPDRLNLCQHPDTIHYEYPTSRFACRLPYRSSPPFFSFSFFSLESTLPCQYQSTVLEHGTRALMTTNREPGLIAKALYRASSCRATLRHHRSCGFFFFRFSDFRFSRSLWIRSPSLCNSTFVNQTCRKRGHQYDREIGRSRSMIGGFPTLVCHVMEYSRCTPYSGALRRRRMID